MFNQFKSAPHAIPNSSLDYEADQTSRYVHTTRNARPDETIPLQDTQSANSPKVLRVSKTPTITSLQWQTEQSKGRYSPLPDAKTRTPFRGWRRAVITASAATGVVLAINSIFAIVASVKFSTEDGVGLLYWGDCNNVKKWDTALHLLINVLGTALLAASNFTMQCLSSPTRSEVDQAHAKGKSLDVGISSFRNLFYIKSWKAFLWWLLCLSSIPLHLLWNSTIFSSAGINEFAYVVATPDFLNGAAYDVQHISRNTCAYTFSSDEVTQVPGVLLSGYQSGTYVRLSAAQCFSDYTSGLLTSRRNLIAVVEPINSTTRMGCMYGRRLWNGSSVIAVSSQSNTVSWMADLLGHHVGDDLLKTWEATINAGGPWALDDFTIDHCFGEVIDAKCQLGFVSWILYIVIGCNAVKLICMGCAARFLWNLDEPILATVGDAVSSFLQEPDQQTQGSCLLDINDIASGPWKEGPNTAIYHRKKRTQLYSATTHTRWWGSMIPCVLYLTIGFVLLGLSLSKAQVSMSEAMKMSFGAVDQNYTLNMGGGSGSGLILDVVVANSFQLALSTTYFLYNSLYTAQCAALEWATFIKGKPKSLRVTCPTGQQRSTYYLQLPYRYGIPLIVASVLMHFLISQSIFLARLTYTTWRGELTTGGFSDVGFSPRANLTTCLVGFLLILAQILHSIRPLDNRMPVHGNQSAVMSAMCHPPFDVDGGSATQTPPRSDKESVATGLISWGVTRQPVQHVTNAPDVDATVQSEPGHCTFSVDTVDLPVHGKEYR